jgi:hypothetical protein
VGASGQTINGAAVNGWYEATNGAVSQVECNGFVIADTANQEI